MKRTVIHRSGEGANAFRVVSYGNGLSYAFQFGEAGHPSRDIFMQGGEATAIRDEYEALEAARPDAPCRDLWFEVLDPYL